MGLVISKGLTLKSYNTPAAIAGVAPTLDYRFALDRREIEAISLTDKLTYTGATNGTFVNRAGLIERATTDQPRFDHGPVSRQSLGLLVEDERTNLLLRSEEFQTTWGATLSTVSTDTTTAPNGAATADSLIVNNTITIINAHISQDVTKPAAALTYSVSVYAKANQYNRITVICHDTGALSNRAIATVDLSNGTFVTSPSAVGTFSNATQGTIVDVGSGWYRIGFTFTTSTETGIRTRLSARDSSATTGDGTSGIYIWGAQLEAGAFPTSYIPTTTTALTRPVDSAVIDGTGVITGTYTLVEKPAGCAVVNGTNIDLVSGFTAERVMVFPAALSAPQITAIRGAM
jgi:hypothetical protein